MTENTDHRKIVSSQQFMGIIEEEYLRHIYRKNGSHNVNLHVVSQSSKKHCKHCGKANHITDNCCWLGSSKCHACGNFGHESADCHKRKTKSEDDDKDKHYPKKSKGENANVAESSNVAAEEDEIIVF